LDRNVDFPVRRPHDRQAAVSRGALASEISPGASPIGEGWLTGTSVCFEFRISDRADRLLLTSYIRLKIEGYPDGSHRNSPKCPFMTHPVPAVHIAHGN
jgi:hypothetical protein